tara:strand:- start:464 stop:925 length:462 start_codon:yes stop_codon:yes gene_type:complete
MLNELFVIISNFYFINFIEYVIHKFSHNPKYGGIFYKYHHKHHTIDYPPNRLTVKILKEDTTLPIIILILNIYLIIYLIIPRYYFYIISIESVSYIYVMNLFHDHYHLIDSPFDKYEWFMKKKLLHHKHHIKTTKNLNLAFNITDNFFNTYLE